VKTLKRREMKEDLPYPKHERRLPAVLSTEEVTRLIASARNLFHHTMLLTSSYSIPARSWNKPQRIMV
jgi:site-specific recombinase XerD